MLVELRTILRKASYPVYYFDWLFDSFVRNFMVFASIEKDFDLTPFDTMSVERLDYCTTKISISILKTKSLHIPY